VRTIWKFLTAFALGILLVACSGGGSSGFWIQLGGALNINPNQMAVQPSLALDTASKPVVAWAEVFGPGNHNIYVKRWNGTLWVQLGNQLDVSTEGDSSWPCLAVDASGSPLVAWEESRNIYAKRWNGTSWVQLGTALNVIPGVAVGNPSLALDAAGNPLVAWHEYGPNGTYNVYIKRWNGNGWTLLGGALNTDTTKDAMYPNLALDTSGNPVVAWVETVTPILARAYVKRWSGTNWVQVGGPVDANNASWVSLALNASANPVVALVGADLRVKYWDGSSWVQLGGAVGSDATFARLSLDAGGYPVVAWTKALSATQRRVYVNRWNGTSWVQVGGGPLNINATQDALFPSLALDVTGQPVVAWQESASSTSPVSYVWVKRFLP